MPSKKTITPLLGNRYYHIFNRGVNRQKIFFTNDNYFYFLRLMAKHLLQHTDMLAYCLLANHFHLVIRVKEEVENDAASYSNEEMGGLVSRQFQKLFIAYAMAINNQENRTGNLFEPKFKRLEIDDEDYLKFVIFYVHNNPERHGVCGDYKSYYFSSYKALSSNASTKINKSLVYDIYGDRDNLENYHKTVHDDWKESDLE